MMSLLMTLAPYAVAYIFLSVCGALVLGRIFATMSPDHDDAATIIPAGAEPAVERRAKPRPRLTGALPT